MADAEQLRILRQGVDAWNSWRERNPAIRPDLSEAHLISCNLGKANLKETKLIRARLDGADLTGAELGGAELYEASLIDANLAGADLTQASPNRANFWRAQLPGATLAGAILTGANLTSTNLSNAILAGASIDGASLLDTNLEGADLTGCRIYGISAWNLKLNGTKQQNLVITRPDEPQVTTDDIEVAQFLYLLINNAKLRTVIDTIGKKAVLILGRFTPERKAVLDALRDELRKRDYLPILFDFDPLDSKDLTGTVTTLANMARFIIADGTDPKSIPHEMATIVPSTFVPVQPILLAGQREYAMFDDLRLRHHWVLPTHPYTTQKQLIADLGECVIRPAEDKAIDIRKALAAARRRR